MEQTLGECRKCMSFLEGEYMRCGYGGWWVRSADGVSRGKQDWERRERWKDWTAENGRKWLKEWQCLWSGRGEQTSPLCPLEVVEPVGPCSSRPSHALSCVYGSHIILCLFVVHIQLFQGFGPLRVCEGLFPLLPSLSGNWGASFILQRRSELLDPLGPCHCEPFCSALHMSLSFPVCSELPVCPRRDLDNTSDLNIWKMGRHKPSLCTEGNLAELPVMRPSPRKAQWLAPEHKGRWAERSEHKGGLGLELSLIWGAAAKLRTFTGFFWAAAACGECFQLQHWKPVLDPIRYNMHFPLIACMRLWGGPCVCPLLLPPAFPVFCHGSASSALHSDLGCGSSMWATQQKPEERWQVVCSWWG